MSWCVPSRSLLAVLLGLAVTWLGADRADGALKTVAQLFQAGAYAEAQQELRRGTDQERSGEGLLWRARLATRPDEAIGLLKAGLEDRGLPRSVRLRLALDLADIEYGREGYAALLTSLTPFLSEGPSSVPGEAYLKAGLALRALGRLQQAREMLASVRPDDPAFGLARVTLGDIGLQQDDPSLALRYYESAERAQPGLKARLAAGRWRALRVEGDDEAAAGVRNFLAENDAGSLAVLEIRRLLQVEEEELAARAAEPASAASSTRPREAGGRYALQLGAFSDRSRALDFLRRYRGQVPQLRIDEVRDQRGQFLYKLRTGAFVSPSLARDGADELARELNLEVIVIDLSDASRPGE